MSWSSCRGASAATRSRPPVRAWRGWRRSIAALQALAAKVLAACSAAAGSTVPAPDYYLPLTASVIARSRASASWLIFPCSHDGRLRPGQPDSRRSTAAGVARAHG